MTKANKIGEGVYRTDDGQWQIVSNGDNYDIEQRVGNRWFSRGSAKTLQAAEKELTGLTKEADAEAEQEAVEQTPVADNSGPNTNATDEGIVPVETEKDN